MMPRKCEKKRESYEGDRRFLGWGSWTSSWLELRDKAGAVSELRTFNTAISSQHWNLGQDKQSFHTLRGSRPRSAFSKPSLLKKLVHISEGEYSVQIVVNGFFLERLCQENSYTLPFRLRGHR